MRAVSAFVLLGVALGACAGNIQPARQLEDAALAQSVRDALRGDPALRAYEITVNANSGAITLLGVVGSTAERDRAGRLASDVPGVTSVENLLSVR